MTHFHIVAALRLKESQQSCRRRTDQKIFFPVPAANGHNCKRRASGLPG